MTPGQTKACIISGIVIFLLLFVWFFFVPPYNTPKFQAIDNNQTGFLVPLDQGTSDQAHFESAAFLKDRKVATKRVQIHRRWVQQGWLYTTGEYLDTERLIVVDRSPVIREWAESDEGKTDDSLRAQTKDGTGLKLNFTCTAYIPESDQNNAEGAEHFLYYYKGDNLAHVMDKEVKAKVQAVASEFTAQYPLETLRGTQHKLVEAVREDVIPFFKKRGISITNIGMVGGFHYVNRQIQKSIDDAISAQQLKIAAQAMQEKEKVEQQTKLYNQEIYNKTMVLEAEGKAKAAVAQAEGEAKAKLAAAQIDAEAAKLRASGEAAAIKIQADAETYKYKLYDQFKDMIISLKNIELEKAWKTQWNGSVPSMILQGTSQSGLMPIFPLNLDKSHK